MKTIKATGELNELYYYYDVPGAGRLEFGKEPASRCGGKLGFHIGVSWGRYGFAGGVLPKEDAKRLAERILKALK